MGTYINIGNAGFNDMKYWNRYILTFTIILTAWLAAGSAVAGVVVGGNVYGGGNKADVGGSVVVNMEDGTVAGDVYGGGALANTNTNNWDYDGGTEYESEPVSVVVGETIVTGLYEFTAPSTYTKVTTENQKAENGKVYYKKVGTWASGKTSADNTTTVSLTGGTINGDAYGGGLGQKTGFNGATSNIAAMVYGDVSVTLGSENGSTATWFNINYYGGDHTDVVKSGRLFGCNNLNGSPQGNVTVTVYMTDGPVNSRTAPAKKNSTIESDHKYQLAAVYGGGNLADYTASDMKANVIIYGCDKTSILTVYGGGNAAAVPETDVDIYAAYEIGAVFGGGNGKDPYTKDKGSSWTLNPGADVNGNANTMLYGGTIHEAFGGSNEKGTIFGSVYINTDTNEDCDLDVGKLYGAGKNADIEGDLIIVLGCKKKRTDEVYGGAENANVKGDVELTITSGEFGKVFGGNNQSGAIFGHIKLNIEETGCTPIVIDELYLGGNEAAYSVYGYYKAQYYQNEGNYYLDAAYNIPLYQNSDGKLYLDEAKTKLLYQKEGETYLYLDEEYKKPLYRPRTSASDGTAVFFGADNDNNHTKAPYADPELNIISCTRIGKVFGGGLGEGAVLYGNPTVNINQILGIKEDTNNSGTYVAATELGRIGVNANGTTTDCGVFGGGNQAKVVGNTTVNIGTRTTVDLHKSVNASSVYTMEEGKPVLGANILSNVYGGGNLADVTGKTQVNVCAKYNSSTAKWESVVEGTAGVTIAGNVYGGGKGVAAESGARAFFCEKAMVGEDGTNDATNNNSSTYAEYGTHVRIGNGTVGTLENGVLKENTGNVYGGGEIGRVEFHTEVVIGLGTATEETAKSPVILGNVFGAGKGANTHGYSGLVRGDCRVTVQAAAKVGHSVYGGGEVASVGKYDVVDGLPKTPLWGGKCTVTIQGYAEIGPDGMQMTKNGGPDDTGHVFGAGKGTLPYESVTGTPWSMQPGGQVFYDESRYVIGEDKLEYEPAYFKFIQSLGLADNTYVTIGEHAFVKGSVYGGSENGYVQTDTHVTIAGGQIGEGQGETAPYADAAFIDPTSTTVTTTNALAACATWTYDKATTGKPYDKYADANGNYPSGSAIASSEGGAPVATDGHTYYGNVFGGGSGVIPFAAGRWHRAAGSVGRNTQVDITGGHILSSVYGGNEHTDVGSYALGDDGEPTTELTSGTGTCTVNISGGTVGVPRTQTQIEDNPVIGNVFGAGKGDKRVLFNTWTNVGTTSVNISGTARIYGSVFGGGEDGHVINNAVTNIGGTFTIGTSEVSHSNVVIGSTGISGADGNVFGGGRGSETALTAGVVGGIVNLTIDNGKILGSVYGGGRLASVGTNFVNPYQTDTDGSILTDESGDPVPHPDYGKMQSGDSHGHVTVTINGGFIGTSTATGVNGNIFGGGKGTVNDFDLGIVKSTTINMTGGTAYASVYGGGELAQVVESHTTNSKALGTEINISGGTIGIQGQGRDIWGNVFAGGKGNTFNVEAGLVKKNTSVSISETDATNKPTRIWHNVYGGGAYGSVGTFTYNNANAPSLPVSCEDGTGTAYITITGGTIGDDGQNDGMVFGSSRGDVGAPGEIHDFLAWVYDTHVTIGEETEETSSSTDTPLIKGSVYGSGENGHTYNDTEVKVHSGTIGIISGAPVTEDGVTYSGANYPYRGNVYGGGCGTDKYYPGDIPSGHTANDGEGDLYNHLAGIVYGRTTVTIDGGQVARNVYGAGAMGSVGKISNYANLDTDGSVYKHESTKPDGAFYGFGLSWPYEFTYDDNTDSDVGQTKVTITGNAVIGVNDENSTGGHVFGAARGEVNVGTNDITVQRYEEAKLANVRETQVIIGTSGGTSTTNPIIYGSVYGGGEDGHVYEDAAVTIHHGNIAHSVFGGGKGEGKYKTTLWIKDPADPDNIEKHSTLTNQEVHSWIAGKVFGSTSVTMNGGKVGYNIYGGGNLASVGKGNYAGGSDDYSTVGYGELGEKVGDDGGPIWTANATSGYPYYFQNSGKATVTINDGEVGTNSGNDGDGIPYGNIFGGSRGKAALDVGRRSPRYRYVPDFFLGYVNDTEVIIGDETKNNDDSYTGPKINGSIYGGGQDGHVRRSTLVTINKGTIGKENDNNADRGNVFGAGSGIGKYTENNNYYCNNSSGSVTCTTTVNINDGTIYRNIYGGGALASVGPPFAGNMLNGMPYDELKETTTGHLSNSRNLVNVKGGSISGDVYGASRGPSSTLLSSVFTGNTYDATKFATSIWSDVNVTGAATIGGSVYGGGEAGIVKHATNVNIGTTGTGGVAYTGTITNDVFGGGKEAVVGGIVTVNMNSGTVSGDVYGGGALANTNVNTNETAVTTVNGNQTTVNSTTGAYNTTNETSNMTTTVNLLGGEIHGDAYGGGLGQRTDFGASSNTPAVVYGDITVQLGDNTRDTETNELAPVNATKFYITKYSGKDIVKTGRIFGCNNLYGSPQGNVTVDVYKTVKGSTSRTEDEDPDNPTGKANKNASEHTYEVAAVYGGGNLADYTPTGKTANVIIETCDVSIESVYGGGNAAKVPGTDVLVKGAYEINEVFGGGNGKDPYTTDDGLSWEENAGADIGTSAVPGNTSTILKGGYVHEAYGGSNKKGTIYGSVFIDIQDGGVCDLDLGKMVGAGKDADVNGDLIMIMGCKPNTYIPIVYGGADNANVNGDVELTITSGKFGQVFGGNNRGGYILGHIKLNIEETGNCQVPIEIDELYLGGNMAKYSMYGYYNAGTDANPNYQPRTAEMVGSGTLHQDAITTISDATVRKTAPYDRPELNIISCTRIGRVYGGGYGSGATLYGDPIVNINMIPGSKASLIDRDGTGGADENARHLGEIGGSYTKNGETLEGGVFGGGDGAVIEGNTTVNIGTATTVRMNTEPAHLGTKGQQYQEVTENGKTVYVAPVEGAYIVGNVYGGGNLANVTGNTYVNICAAKDAVLDDDDEPTGEYVYNPVTIETTTANQYEGVTIKGDVFGGGKGKEDTYECEKAMIGNNDDGAGKDPDLFDKGTRVTIGNGTVEKNVYGGGEVGRVEWNTVVTIGLEEGEDESSAPLIKGNVFGAGAGKETHGYSALVRGNSTVTVQGHAKVEKNVYGGGEKATVGRYWVSVVAEDPNDHAPEGMPSGMPYKTKGGGICRVNVLGKAQIGPDGAASDIAGHVFGAGKGIDPDYHYDATDEAHSSYRIDNTGHPEYFTTEAKYLEFLQTLALVTNTYVTINGDASVTSVKGSVYGGSESGFVQDHTNVTIQSGNIGTTGTTYGNVFGGGKGLTTFAEAGKVKGNTTVDVSGGTTYGNVYGGGELGDVGTINKTDANNYKWTNARGAVADPYTYNSTGVCNVTITGGTVGSAEDNATTDEFHGNVFGGGKGKDDTYQCEKAMVYDAIVSISGGQVKRNVYGGGQISRVENDTQVTIGLEKTADGSTTYYQKQGEDYNGVVLTAGQSVVGYYTRTGEEGSYVYTLIAASDPVVEGNVFGAGAGLETHGYSALVRGNSTVTVQGSARVKQNVYGGGEKATVGRYWVSVVAEDPNDHAPEGMPSGMPYKTKDGGICRVNVLGKAQIGPDGAASDIAGHVFGAGKGIDPDYHYDATDEAHSSYRIDNTGHPEYFTTEAKYLEFLQTLALVTNTYVTINGDASVTSVKGSVYGGSESGFVQDHTNVSIQNGKIGIAGAAYGHVFGGGRGLLEFAEAGKVKGNTTVAVSGGTTYGNIYGGGNLGDVGTIDKTETDSNNQPTYNYAWKQAGGKIANTPLNNTIDDDDNDNTGICKVTITGGIIGSEEDEDDPNHGNVFGAGQGSDRTWWCEKAIAYATVVSVSDGTIYGSVYGGGQVGRVEDDGKVTIGTENLTGDTPAPDIKGDVFGAGAGLATHGYSALLRGNSQVTVQGIAKVGGKVYGGGETASVGKFKVVGGLPSKPLTGGTCMVTIQDNAKIGESGTDHNVFGACKGVDTSYDSENPKNFKSMQLYANGTKNGTKGTDWDDYKYEDEDGVEKVDSRFVWKYYTTEDAYLSFLKTLALTSNTDVTIGEDATVNGSVYGGGERGVTLGSVAVKMTGGTVNKDVYGGGALADTNTGNWEADEYEPVTGLTASSKVVGYYERSGDGSEDNPYVYTPTTDETSTGKTYYRKGIWADLDSDPNFTAYFTTNVVLTGGTINGDAYGGGLGRKAQAAVSYQAAVPAEGTEGEPGYVPAQPEILAQAAVTPVEAKVYGDVLVKLNETIATDNCVVKGSIFGCNNANGSPQRAVTVHIYKTQGYEGHWRTAVNLTDADEIKAALDDPDDTHHSYELLAVYGGGNQAAFRPDDEEICDTVQPRVIIDGCQLTSIKTVYGGGNAASVPATNVKVNGTYEIEEVFGGGNGYGTMPDGSQNPGANVGYTYYDPQYDPPASSKEERTSEFAYGSGKANVDIVGGRIHRVFGGSNTKGNVRESAVTILQDLEGCVFSIDEAYGGGKNAPMDAKAELLMACIPGLKAAFGGAQDADIQDDVTLTITNGTFDRVFGGNNVSGTIHGTITVNVEETGCKPLIIGQLYGGGNQAPYEAPAGKNGPTLNVKSFTSIGDIYGGGYGETAVVKGDTYVNINVCEGKYAGYAFTEEPNHKITFNEYRRNKDGIGEESFVHENGERVVDQKIIGVLLPGHEKDKIGAINNVFGGGNAAPVQGSTNVNIGTLSDVYVTVVDAFPEGTILGTTEGYTDIYTFNETTNKYVAATGEPNANVTYYKKLSVVGVDIRGNVYGGGNAAEVTGDTNVVIGKSEQQ